MGGVADFETAQYSPYTSLFCATIMAGSRPSLFSLE